MALSPYYATGTVSVTNGSKTVTASGTLFLSALPAGFAYELQLDGLVGAVDTVDSNTQITLKDNWPGTDRVGVSYRIKFVAPASGLASQTTALINLLSNGVLSGVSALSMANGEVLQYDGANIKNVSVAASLKSLLTTDNNFAQRVGGSVVERTPVQVLTSLIAAGAADLTTAQTLTNKTISGGTMSGVTVAGATTLPGSGQITSGGYIGIGHEPAHPIDLRIDFSGDILTSISNLNSGAFGRAGLRFLTNGGGWAILEGSAANNGNKLDFIWDYDGTQKNIMQLNSVGVGLGLAADGSDSTPQVTIRGNGYSGQHWLDSTAYYIGQNSNSRALRLFSGTDNTVGAQLSGTTWSTYSDERLKTISPEQTDMRAAIRALWIGEFEFKNDGRYGFGVLAQQANSVLPAGLRDVLTQPPINDKDWWTAAAEPAAYLGLWGVKDLYVEIDSLISRLEILERKYA